LVRVVKDVFILAKEVLTRAFVDEMDAFNRDKDAFKLVIKDSDA